MKENHSKGKEIVYGSLQMRKYLNSPNISVEKAKLLLQLRSRMAPFRENYRGMYPSDSTCPLCESGTPDTQQHIITCPEIKLQSSEKIQYSWLFGNNPDKLLKVANVFQEAMKQRESLLQEK